MATEVKDLVPHEDPTYAVLNSRGGRRMDPRKGLPNRENLVKLAEVWLRQQRRHWPELVEARTLANPTESTLKSLADGYVERFLSQQTEIVEALPESVSRLVLGTAYLRYSSSQQNPRSLDDQLHQILEWAARERIYVPWEYVNADAEVSGKIARRTGYQRALSILRLTGATSPGVLLIDEIDRMSRDGLEILATGQEIQDLGKRMVGVTNGFDSNTQESRMMLYVMAMFNDQFMTQHRDKVIRGRSGAMRRKQVIRSLPWGLKRVPLMDGAGNPVLTKKGTPAHTAAVDEDKRHVIEQMAEFYVDRNYSLREVAKELNRTKAGGREDWSVTTISELLKNRSFVGIIIEGKQRNVRDRKTGKQTIERRPRNEWRVMRIPEAQIWSWKRWKQICAKRKENSELSFENSRRSKLNREDKYATTLFSRVLYCEYCRRPLKLMRGGKNNHSMCCTNGTAARHGCQLTSSKSSGIYEPALVQYLLESVLTPERVDALVEQANHYVRQLAETPPVDRRPLENSLSKLQRQRDRVVDFLASSADPDLDAVRKKVKSLETEAREIRQRLAAITESEKRVLCPLSREQVMAALPHARDLLKADVRQANAAIKMLTGPIWISQHKPSISKKNWVWKARFRGNLMPLLAHVAQKSDLPCASNLMNLMERDWKIEDYHEVELKSAHPLWKVHLRSIERMREEGVGRQHICRDLGICATVLDQAVRYLRTGLDPVENTKPVPLHEAIADKVVALRQQGINNKEIAQKLSISTSTVWKACRYAEGNPVPSRPATVQIPAYQRHANRAYVLRVEGISNMEIAERLGVSEATVRRALTYAEQSKAA